jgi:hypothetical protein
VNPTRSKCFLKSHFRKWILTTILFMEHTCLFVKITMKWYIKSLHFAAITTVWHGVQLRSDIYALNWDVLYGMADPEVQIQYFNAIIMWLLELHAPLRRYIISTDVNPDLPLTSKKLWLIEILHIEFESDERLPRTEQDRTTTESQLFGVAMKIMILFKKKVYFFLLFFCRPLI